MTEGQIIIPAYFRTGKCASCGADVYAPGAKPVDGGLPSMSACTCDGGPKLAHQTESRPASLKREADSLEKARAA